MFRVFRMFYDSGMDLFRFWTLPDRPPKQTDCLVVLSYAVEDAQTPTAPTRAAIRLAFRWWQRFPKALVIMSTGDNQRLGIPNSRIMKEYGVHLGIPERQIIEEPVSLTTVENLKYSKQVFNKHGCRHMTLVLYDLHVRRTLAIAGRAGWRDISWISATGHGSPAFGIKRFQTFSRSSIFIYEILAWIYNRMNGQL